MDAHNGGFRDPEICALLERAEAAMLRSREVIANMDLLARTLADAAHRSDEWLAARKGPTTEVPSDDTRSIEALAMVDRITPG